MIRQRIGNGFLVSLLLALILFSVALVRAHDPGELKGLKSADNNENQMLDCGTVRAGSLATSCTGNLSVDYSLPAYRSLGISRSLRFVYNSTTADVRPIVTADIPPFSSGVAPATISTLLNVSGERRGNEVFYDGAGLPFSVTPFRVARQFDANTLSTGLYPSTLQIAVNYPNASFNDQVSSQVLVNNQRNSPFGIGWTLDGLERLHLLPNNRAVLTEGDGSAKVFRLDGGGPPVNFNRNFRVETRPEGVAVGDFNNDSISDLAVANTGSDSVSVLLGNGDGTFQTTINVAVQRFPRSVAVGDLRGNGTQDLLVANYLSASVSVLLGNGDGTFQPPRNVPVGTGPFSVVVGDFNNDGKLDFAVTKESLGNVSIALGDGTGGFQTPRDFPVGRFPTGLVTGDFDGDGNLDLAVASTGSNNVTVLFGDGNGGIRDVRTIALGHSPGRHNRSITAGDFRGIGQLDLAVVGNSPSGVSLLLGDGQGGFAPPQIIPLQNLGPATDISAADLRGNGRLDLVVGMLYTNVPNVWVLLGDGQGRFSAPMNFSLLPNVTGSAPAVSSPSTAIADFNSDGKPDLAVVSAGSGNVQLLFGDGTGLFSQLPGPNQVSLQRCCTASAAVGDFNNDGNLDFIVSGGQVVTMLLGDGTGGFRTTRNAAVTSAQCDAVTVGDFNRDGNQM